MKDKILIIDDDKEYIFKLVKLLEKEGYAVSYTTNGQTAFNMFESTRYDLIILDLHMPNVDGLEILKDLKDIKSNRLTPVIISTSDTSTDVVVKAIKYGADDYMVKPIDVELFLDKVHVLLRIRHFVKKWGVLPR